MGIGGSESAGEDKEKNRVCPSCRMMISVFATKCRYCGEEIGKPKEETRELSSSDLGGETIHHRASSGSVMDALESFRLEETDGEAEESGNKALESPDLDGLPELDSESMNLAAAVSSSGTHSYTKTSYRQEESAKERALKIGGIVLGIVVVLFGGVKGIGWISSTFEERNAPPVVVYVNRAPKLMNMNAPSIEVLEAAAEAIERENTGENRGIVEQALKLVVEDFEALLNAEQHGSKWSLDRIGEAVTLARSASKHYPNEVTQGMFKESTDEFAAYSISLTRLNPSTGGGYEATFSSVPGDSSTVIVKKGDSLLSSRFTVQSIVPPRVHLRDTIRKSDRGSNRVLEFRVGQVEPSYPTR